MRRSTLLALLVTVTVGAPRPCLGGAPDDQLIDTLNNAASYLARADAASRMTTLKDDPRAVWALLWALRPTEHTAVRSAAATALGAMGDPELVAYLEPATRDKARPVRERSRKALGSLRARCPDVSPKGKKVYLRIHPLELERDAPDRFRYVRYVRARMVKAAEETPWMTPRWTGCKPPSKRQLRARKLKAYQVRGSIRLSHAEGQLTCNLRLVLTSFPGNHINMAKTVTGTLEGASSSDLIETCLEATVPVAFEGIRSYVARSR